MTLRQDKDRSGDIAFDTDHTWEAYGSNKAKIKDGQKKKDRESHRLGSTKKESRQPHRLGGAKDGFGEASNSSFALDHEAGFSHDWKSFTDDQGWSEMDRQQAKAWKTAQSERNLTRGDGRRASASRSNSSSSSLDFEDFQDESRPALKVNPSVGITRVERSASTRMVPKVTASTLKQSSSENQHAGREKQARGISPVSAISGGISPSAPSRGVRRNKSSNLQNLQLGSAIEPTRVRTRRRTSIAADLNLENNLQGSDMSGRRAPQRTKSLDVDMFGTSGLSFTGDVSNAQASESNLGSAQSFRLGGRNDAPPGKSRRRASLALNAHKQQNPNDAPGELVRAGSRRRASLAVGAILPPSSQDLQPDLGPNEGIRTRSRRRASLAVNAAPEHAAALQNLQLDTPNETPRVRTRRRASMAANDSGMDGRRGVQRTRSMDVDMLGSIDGSGGSGRALGRQRSFRNVRRINSTDSHEISLRNPNRLSDESASGITNEAVLPRAPPHSRSPRTRSPRMTKKEDPSGALDEGMERKSKLSPRSRRLNNIRRINSVDSTSTSNEKDIQKALSNNHSESPTTSRRKEQGHRHRGVQRVNSSGLHDLISGLESKKKADLDAELNAGEDQGPSDTGAPKPLETHLEEQKSTVPKRSGESVSNDSSTTSNTSHANGGLRKMMSRSRSARLQKHPGASRSAKEGTSGAGKLNGNFESSASNSLKAGESESSMSEHSRSTSGRFSRQHLNERSGLGSAGEGDLTPNSSRGPRKRRETPKRGVNRSKSTDDSMTFGAWTSGDSSVRSRKNITRSPSRRKSVAAGECQSSAPHSKQTDKELLEIEDDTVSLHDKGFIASFLGSPDLHNSAK